MPTVGFHDTGDMITASAISGVSHAPGYPLYCLLGKLWITFLPLGNIAFRMNLFSAIAAAVAVGMVYFIILKIISIETKKDKSNSSIISGIIGSLLLAFGATFWEQAVMAEKYTLNGMFVTLLIFILLKWHECLTTKSILKGQNYLLLFSFTLGLSFTHHYQTLFIIPAGIFFIGITSLFHKRTFSHCCHDTTCSHLRGIISLFHKGSFSLLHEYKKALILFLLPLAIYLYLPIRASNHPMYNFGDPQTIQRFIDHITAKEFTGNLTSSIPTILNSFKEHIPAFFVHQFTWVGVILALIGMIVLGKKKRTTSSILVLITLADIVYSIRYRIYNVEDYYIPAFICFCIWISVGIFWCKKFLSKNVITNFIISILLLLFPLYIANIRYHKYLQRDYYFSYDYAYNVLKSVEERGIVLLDDYNVTLPASYLHYVEGIKKDEIILLSKEFLDYNLYTGNDNSWYLNQIKERHNDFLFTPEWYKGINMPTQEEVDALKVGKFKDILIYNPTRSIYSLSYEPSLIEGYTSIPSGVLYRTLKKDLSSDEIMKIFYRGVGQPHYRGHNSTFGFNSPVFTKYSYSHLTRAIYCQNHGMYLEAIKELKKALRFIPESSDAKNNLAIAYYYYGMELEQMGDKKQAIKNYIEAIHFKPDYSDAYRAVSLIFYKDGKVKEAIVYLKKALEIIPADISTRKNLAVIYYSQGLFEEAIKECNTILSEDPTNSFAKQMIGAITQSKRREKGE